MTANDTTRTQVAAQHCADLANAVNKTSVYRVDSFYEGNGYSGQIAFRREVEAKDAMIREVLALLAEGKDDTAIRLLRDNLLPDPVPTLLEEFEREKRITVKGDTRDVMEAFADWIAKRQENAG